MALAAKTGAEVQVVAVVVVAAAAAAVAEEVAAVAVVAEVVWRPLRTSAVRPRRCR